MQEGFPDNVVAMKTEIILATIDVYNTSMESLLPTPTKSHYLFNLRDVARVIYGLTMLPPSTLPAGRAGVTKYVRLWVHETLRVFYDRLTDDSDRLWLLNYLKDVTAARLGSDFDDAFRHLLPTSHAQAGLEDLRSVFFTDFMDEAAEEPHQRKYDEGQVGTLLVNPCLGWSQARIAKLRSINPCINSLLIGFFLAVSHGLAGCAVCTSLGPAVSESAQQIKFCNGVFALQRSCIYHSAPTRSSMSSSAVRSARRLRGITGTVQRNSFPVVVGAMTRPHSHGCCATLSCVLSGGCCVLLPSCVARTV